MATILMRWFGGSKRDWLRVHDKAFEWWLREWTRNQKLLSQSHKFQSTFRNIEAGWIKQILKEAGLPVAWTDQELFGIDRRLVYEIGLHTKMTYPWIESTLARLKDSGHTVYLTSGADPVFITGALRATGLRKYFTRVFSIDELNTVKGSVGYWKRVFRLSRSKLNRSIVVDDRIDYLRIPGRLGALTVSVGTGRNYAFKADVRIRSLRSLPCALPTIPVHKPGRLLHLKKSLGD